MVATVQPAPESLPRHRQNEGVKLAGFTCTRRTYAAWGCGVGGGSSGVQICETCDGNLGFEVSETWLIGKPRNLGFGNLTPEFRKPETWVSLKPETEETQNQETPRSKTRNQENENPKPRKTKTQNPGNENPKPRKRKPKTQKNENPKPRK